MTTDTLAELAGRAETVADLAECLRLLQRRAAAVGDGRHTYRRLAKSTGWSHGIIGAYFTGKVLPPTARLDELAQLLGASPPEMRALASARDRIEDGNREQRTSVQSLPMPLSRVTVFGREEQLTALDQILLGENPHGLAAVLGPPGVGKTSLVVEWVRRRSTHFDQVHYLDVKGLRDGVTPLTSAEVLRLLLLSTGVNAQAIPAQERARSELLARMVGASRTLIVLDDVEDADQVRSALLPQCSVIAISKMLQYVLIAADGAVPVTVSALTPEASYAVLRDRVGPHLDQVKPEMVEEVLQACGGWPIALTLVAARARTNPTMPFSTAGLFTGADDARTNLMTLMLQSFSRLSPAARGNVFAMIAHPGGIITAAQLACLAKISLSEASDLLAEYAGIFALLDVDGGWLLHPMVREFLLRLPGVPRDLSAEERFVKHLAASAYSAALRMDHGTSLACPQVPADTIREPFTGPGEAADWARTFDPWLVRQMTSGGELSGWFAQARAELHRLAPTAGEPGRRQLANLTVSSWAAAV